MNDRSGPGSQLIGNDAERLTVQVWPQLAQARDWQRSRAMGDLRDVLDGLDVENVTPAERARIVELYEAFVASRAARAITTGGPLTDLSVFAAL